MGTNANQIATENEAYAKGGSISGNPSGNKCCTKARAKALGCDVSGTYADNQLVKYQDLSKTAGYYLRNMTSYYVLNFRAQAGSIVFSGNFAPGATLKGTGSTPSGSWNISGDNISSYGLYITPAPSGSVYSYYLYRN